MKTITSAANPIFKDARKLASNSKPEEGRLLVEGVKLINEALSSGAEIEAIFIYEDALFDGFLPHLKKYCIKLSAKLFRELSTLQTPAESIGIFKFAVAQTLEEILQRPGIIIVMDRVQDPGNLGTIIRTSEAMGASAILLLEGSCSACNSKVTRAAMGSSFRLPIFSKVNYQILVKLLVAHDFDIIATAMDGQSLYNMSFSNKTALFLGQEGSGLDPQILKDCTQTLAIPMQGQVESLNVATSAAICLYEWSRQKNNRTTK